MEWVFYYLIILFYYEIYPLHIFKSIQYFTCNIWSDYCFIFLIHLIPGDPVRIMLHGRATDEVVKQIYQELGWDKPILSQYFDFLFNAIRGDIGKSYIQKALVSDLIFERMAPSVFY